MFLRHNRRPWLFARLSAGTPGSRAIGGGLRSCSEGRCGVTNTPGPIAHAIKVKWRQSGLWLAAIFPTDFKTRLGRREEDWALPELPQHWGIPHAFEGADHAAQHCTIRLSRCHDIVSDKQTIKLPIVAPSPDLSLGESGSRSGTRTCSFQGTSFAYECGGMQGSVAAATRRFKARPRPIPDVLYHLRDRHACAQCQQRWSSPRNLQSEVAKQDLKR